MSNFLKKTDFSGIPTIIIYQEGGMYKLYPFNSEIPQAKKELKEINKQKENNKS